MGAKEHFTHGILRRLRIAEHSPANAAYVSAVLAKQRGERLAIAGKRTFDEGPRRLVIHLEAVSPMPLPRERIGSFLEARVDPQGEQEAVTPSSSLTTTGNSIRMTFLARLSERSHCHAGSLTLEYEWGARKLRRRLTHGQLLAAVRPSKVQWWQRRDRDYGASSTR